MPASLLPVLAGLALLAQAPAALATRPPAPPTGPTLTVGIEQRAEQYRYRFDHPSNFDTVDLVPHFFEQRYDAGNTWLLASATYRFLGARGVTEAGVTPTRTTAGSDIDTFFDPSGDVITSGTDGRVRLRSFSLDQRFGLVERSRWTIGVAVGYRRSRADFLPEDIYVTHTQPVSTARTFTTTRETTVSGVIQSGVTADARWGPIRGWHVALAAEGLPLTRARLVITLPDKYPAPIVNDARAFAARGRVTVERPWSRLVVGAAVRASGAWGYRRTAGYHEDGAGVGVFVRIRR